MTDAIRFNKKRKRWEWVRNGLVIASAIRLLSLTRRFPDVPVEGK